MAQVKISFAINFARLLKFNVKADKGDVPYGKCQQLCLRLQPSRWQRNQEKQSFSGPENLLWFSWNHRFSRPPKMQSIFDGNTKFIFTEACVYFDKNSFIVASTKISIVSILGIL